MASVRTKRLEFTVESRGFDFPYDMLRYDSCWPKGQEDVREMELSHEPDRDRKHVYRVTLCSDIEAGGYQEKVKQGPTDDRWSSFLWSVVRGSVKIDNRIIR